MSIEMMFVAEDLDDLAAQVWAFAERLARPAAVGAIGATTAPVSTLEPATATLEETFDAPVEPAPVKREKRAKPSAKIPPTNGIEAVKEELAARLAPEPEPEEIEAEPALPTKEMLALKEKVIGALQAAFRAGKVQKVRAVLSQYGDGAKSFREIDIATFPAIDKVIQKGALD